MMTFLPAHAGLRKSRSNSMTARAGFSVWSGRILTARGSHLSQALSRTVAKTLVIPYLLDIRAADVQGPLAVFNMCQSDREGTFKMLATINNAMGPGALPEQNLTRIFDRFWPDLEQLMDEARKAPPPRMHVGLWMT